MFQIRRKSDGTLFNGTAKSPKFGKTSSVMFAPTGVRSFMGHVKKYHKNGMQCDDAIVDFDDLEVVQVKMSLSEPTPLGDFICNLNKTRTMKPSAKTKTKKKTKTTK